MKYEKDVVSKKILKYFWRYILAVRTWPSLLRKLFYNFCFDKLLEEHVASIWPRLTASGSPGPWSTSSRITPWKRGRLEGPRSRRRTDSARPCHSSSWNPGVRICAPKWRRSWRRCPVGRRRCRTDRDRYYKTVFAAAFKSAIHFSKVFFNGPTPASFLFILCLLKQAINFLQQINAKNVMSIQYRVPVFKPILSNLSRLP